MIVIRAIVVAVGIWTFGQSTTGEDVALPAGLYLPTRATQVARRSRTNGIVDLTYELADEYPPNAFITELKAALKSRGWAIPQNDPLDPGTANWLGGRWSEGTGPVEKPRPYSRQWDGLWADGDDQVARYVLQYTRLTASPERWSTLKVVAVYWPGAVTRSVRKRTQDRK
jgi:hypothetical protein